MEIPSHYRAGNHRDRWESHKIYHGIFSLSPIKAKLFSFPTSYYCSPSPRPSLSKRPGIRPPSRNHLPSSISSTRIHCQWCRHWRLRRYNGTLPSIRRNESALPTSQIQSLRSFDPTVHATIRSIHPQLLSQHKVVAPHGSWTISPSPQSPRFYLLIRTHAVLCSCHRSGQRSLPTINPFQHGLKTRPATVRCSPAAVNVHGRCAHHLPKPTLCSGPERF